VIVPGPSPEGKSVGVKLYRTIDTPADACGGALTSPDGRKADGGVTVLTISLFAF